MDAIDINIREIQKILPQRYPFLLVDKVVDLDLEHNRIVAIKNVSINEPFFQGHFPGKPIMPGVLIIESLAQAGSILIHQKKLFSGRLAVLLKISEVKFRRQVIPGDTLHLEIEFLHFSSRGGKVKGQALVDGQMATQAEITFALTNP
ncbi:MAG: 3-hydroxyacyl-ACP dehydratase FabZ [Chlamydiota bacterium]